MKAYRTDVPDMKPAPHVLQKHYRMEPPYEGFQFVVSSASRVPYSGPETYLFGADEKGEIIEWGELRGSFKGELDCEQAIRNAGYEIA